MSPVGQYIYLYMLTFDAVGNQKLAYIHVASPLTARYFPIIFMKDKALVVLSMMESLMVNPCFYRKYDDVVIECYHFCFYYTSGVDLLFG